MHDRCSAHVRHVHPGATVLAVYYVLLPEGAGKLAFSDPRGALPPFENMAGIRPREDELVTFPPWVGHEVMPNCGATSDKRIPISFNLVDDELEHHWGDATAGYVATLPVDAHDEVPERRDEL